MTIKDPEHAISLCHAYLTVYEGELKSGYRPQEIHMQGLLEQAHAHLIFAEHHGISDKTTRKKINEYRNAHVSD